MKVLMFLAAIAFATLSNAGEYTAASASGYKCKDMGDSVCAMSVTTGQCTQEWDEDDGGLFQCQKWTGEVKVKPVDKSTYTCKATSDGACAVKQSTGQCGPSWSDDDGGMNQCQKWTGEVKVKAINKSKYVCKKTTNGYCAQNTITGQCGHEWSNEDGDAKFFCKKWINQ